MDIYDLNKAGFGKLCCNRFPVIKIHLNTVYDLPTVIADEFSSAENFSLFRYGAEYHASVGSKLAVTITNELFPFTLIKQVYQSMTKDPVILLNVERHITNRAVVDLHSAAEMFLAHINSSLGYLDPGNCHTAVYKMLSIAPIANSGNKNRFHRAI